MKLVLLSHLLLIILFILCTIVSYSHCSTEKHQLMAKYSFNFNDSKTISSSLSSLYTRYGDTIKLSSGYLITPLLNNVFGFIALTSPIKAKSFELQLTFKSSRLSSYGSLFSIWFYEGNDSLFPRSMDDNYLGFVSEHKGFGIAMITKPRKHTIPKTIIKIVLKNNNKEETDESEGKEDISEASLGMGCYEELGEFTRITIRYNDGVISVYNNSTENLFNKCFEYQSNNVVGETFRYGFGSKNGLIDNIIFKDSIEVRRISLFNKDSKFIELYNEEEELVALSKEKHEVRDLIDSIKNNKSQSDSHKIIKELAEKSLGEIYYKQNSTDNIKDMMEIMNNLKAITLNNENNINSIISNISQLTHNITTINNTINNNDNTNKHHQIDLNNITLLLTSALTLLSSPPSPFLSKPLISSLTNLSSSFTNLTHLNTLLSYYYLNQITITSHLLHSSISSYSTLLLFLLLLLVLQFLLILFLFLKLS